MVWTGNALRQPAFKGIAHRAPERRPAERRPGHGAGPDPAVQPQPQRRRHRLHLGDRRGGAPVSAARFAGRRVLVTGASRGIGAATAERLRGRGRRRRDRRPHRRPARPPRRQPAARPPSGCARYGGTVAVVVADLTDGDDRARIVPEAVDGLGGPIDVLVNNAAAAMYGPLADFPLKRRRITFEVNVHAPLDLAQAVLPSMLERGEGWIVNVSSATARPGRRARPGRLRRVEGGAQPHHARTRRRGRRHRRPRQHRRAAGGGDERGRRRARRRPGRPPSRSSRWRRWSRPSSRSRDCPADLTGAHARQPRPDRRARPHRPRARRHAAALPASTSPTETAP